MKNRKIKKKVKLILKKLKKQQNLKKSLYASFDASLRACIIPYGVISDFYMSDRSSLYVLFSQGENRNCLSAVAFPQAMLTVNGKIVSIFLFFPIFGHFNSVSLLSFLYFMKIVPSKCHFLLCDYSSK